MSLRSGTASTAGLSSTSTSSRTCTIHTDEHPVHIHRAHIIKSMAYVCVSRHCHVRVTIGCSRCAGRPHRIRIHVERSVCGRDRRLSGRRCCCCSLCFAGLGAHLLGGMLFARLIRSTSGGVAFRLRFGVRNRCLRCDGDGTTEACSEA